MKKYDKSDFNISKETTNKVLKIFGDYYKYRKLTNEKISAADYIKYSSYDMSREKVNTSRICDGTAAAVERAEKEWFKQRKAEMTVKIIDSSIKKAAEYARPNMRRKIETVLKKSLIDKIRREYLDCSKEMLSKYRKIAVYYVARNLDLLNENDRCS